MMAGRGDFDRLGMGPPDILRAAEEVQRRHGQRDVRLLREAAEDAGNQRTGNVGIDGHPPRGLEHPLHGRLGSEDQEVDHVAGVALAVAHASGQTSQQRCVHAVNRVHSPRNRRTGAIAWGEHLDVHRKPGGARIVVGPIDAEEQGSSCCCRHLRRRADHEGLRDVGFANPPDQRAAAGLHRQHAQQVPEPSRNPDGSKLSLTVTDPGARAGEYGPLSGLHVDVGGRPDVADADLDVAADPGRFLRHERRRLRRPRRQTHCQTHRQRGRPHQPHGRRCAGGRGGAVTGSAGRPARSHSEAITDATPEMAWLRRFSSIGRTIAKNASKYRSS